MGYICDTKEVADAIAHGVKELFHSVGSVNFKVKINQGPFRIEFWLLDNNDNEIAHFKLQEQTGCCGILVSTKTSVSEKYRGRGIAQELMLLKKSLAKEFGYGLLLATVNLSGNPAEAHILEKTGWTKLNEFINPHTSHLVGVFSFKLEDYK
jgi:GNAT superfamily N-acetyltransferase